ncbi:Serine-threonine/tyrosine-protein kinase catalytic domain [Arabidopsis thaliana x Arabidopsis arenosa]|uniref:non-specific serine/threonine protein kinase n=1 Tax=Arabidopsis thaliana x Arabidopsis arenosa TaxID=1240361 RepID=A0A8T2GPL8_9BRAS|nr:Serine-threonine/tyrosine-protein kinase catalytic domain [Arabidopsis thaliana x Arabidopsis arenosa]
MTEATGLRRFFSKFICCDADDSTIEYEPYVYIPANSYSYAEVTKITNKFNRVHGKGGFGVVYRGVLNKQQVAVKMLNRASIYNIVHDFVKVRHKNLVSLIGYCDDGEHLALIYEFVANGDLNDQLSGKFGNVLSWETRLKIIIGVAQGLEYLHSELRILHRYVKPTNILLGENFEAKLADFGLSRSSPTNPDIQASNKIYVKPGRDPYLDDQYFNSNWLTQTSDIYSFGIVMLEMITNQPVVDNKRESPHISKWVNLKVAKGDTLEIVDLRLKNDFEPDSVRKAMDIACSCAARAHNRPSMSQVVIELNKCLALEMARSNGRTGETTQTQ